MVCNIFFPVCELSFDSLYCDFREQEIFNFDDVQFINFYFMDHISDVIAKQSFCKRRS